ncbi:MAG: hypothetical protein KDA51_12175, partial [Planctomycetales bacterium]|nr:hypothetical protein [Planctomycetales bacterium]
LWGSRDGTRSAGRRAKGAIRLKWHSPLALLATLQLTLVIPDKLAWVRCKIEMCGTTHRLRAGTLPHDLGIHQ